MPPLGHNTARALKIMFVASSSEPLPSYQVCSNNANGGGGGGEKLRYYVL